MGDSACPSNGEYADIAKLLIIDAWQVRMRSRALFPGMSVRRLKWTAARAGNAYI